MSETVGAIIQSVIEDMCDKYCKYPEQYKDDEDRMYDERCDKCPLNRL